MATSEIPEWATPREQLVDEYMTLDGPSMTWEVEHRYGHRVNAGGKTISPEAYDGLNTSMAVWLGTRIMRRMNAGKKATKVRVKLTVEFPE